MRKFILSSIPVFALTALFSVAGCGGGGNRANVSPAPMPEGGTFTGVWHSPQYGEMHMVQTGTQVVGCYTKDERRGRLQGTASGNLMRFEWNEMREMVSGRPTQTRGRGYFQVAVDESGHFVFTGEWGHDDSEVGGGPWNAWRDRRATIRPDPDCGARSSGGSTSGGDSFDSGGGGGGDSFDDDGSSGGGGGGGGDDLGDL